MKQGYLDIKVRTKVEQFMLTLSPDLQTFIRQHCFLAGGAIHSILSDTKPNDWDFYLYRESSLSDLDVLLKNYKQKLIETKWAKTILPIKVQFITRKIGTPLEIVNTFDFVHCQYYYEFHTQDTNHPTLPLYSHHKIVFNPEATYPFNTMERVVKYVQKGMEITPIELGKIAVVINRMTLNKEEFEDQLESLYNGEAIKDKLLEFDSVIRKKKFKATVEKIVDEII